MAGALAGDIPAETLARMTAISDRIVGHIPNTGNLFGRLG